MNNMDETVNYGDGTSSLTVPNKVDEESFWSNLDNESILQELLNEPFDFENSVATPVATKLRQDENYKGFDNNSGRHWIYPINFPIRQYQLNIAKTSLYKNTLVVLPTGLGKTFIAAVVMYNMFRWYPMGKIIFMAPTRPLVAQQIEACRKIMGIPLSDTAEMTGRQNKKKRVDLWRTKRIFFATPQVIQSDISDIEQNFPFNSIKLVVIDEAHKAKGRYAYVEVVQSIQARNRNFRTLALTATPGRRLEDVGEIIQNLFISKIEVRWENCIDVAQYTHKRNIKIVNVPLGDKLTEVREKLINIIDPYIRNLMDHGFLTSNGNSDNISKGWILMEQKRFREISMHHRHENHSKIATDFCICVSLYHSLELLERHGLRVFISFFDNPDPKNKTEKFFVKTNFQLQHFLNEVRDNLGPNPFAVTDKTMPNGQIPCVPDNIDFGHPKFEMVKKILITHFQENKDSQVIVFCEFRESVMLMHRLLLQTRPLIKPQIFVGQGSGTGTMRAVVTQKQQLKIMNDFRQNVCNTLIATCVAEEGLDIGEVDLIICFDISTKNPTRLVQRIGRTGRKREGKIIMMVTEGKEQNLVKETLANRDKINQKLSKSREIINCLYKYSPRLVPPQFNPICLEMYMKDQSENIETESVKEINCKELLKKKTEKKPGKKRKNDSHPIKNSDVRNFFRKISLDEEEQEVFCTPMTTQQKQIQINTIKTEIICLNDCDDYNFNENTQEIKGNQNSEKCTVFLTDKENLQIPNLRSTFSTKSFESVANLKSSTSTTSLPCSNDTDLKIKLRKFNRLTRNMNKPKNKNMHDYANIVETLKSKRIDNRVKKFLLAHNIDFVHRNFESMKILSAFKNEEQEVEVVDKSENEIRLIYSLIESVVGGKQDINTFIKNNNKNAEHILKKFITKYSMFQQDNANSANDNIDEWIDVRLQNFTINDLDIINGSRENTMKNNQTLMDSESEISVDFVTESKYANQFNEELPIKAHSTPLALNNSNTRNFTKQFFNSSPITIKKNEEKVFGKIIAHKNLEEAHSIIPIQNKEKLQIIHQEQRQPLGFNYKNNSAFKRLEFSETNATFKNNDNYAEIKNKFLTINNPPKKIEWFENKTHNFTKSKKEKIENDRNILAVNQEYNDLSIIEFNVQSPNKSYAPSSELLQAKSGISLSITKYKDDEKSADLFDDDFDEFVANSENILQTIETKSNVRYNEWKSSENKTPFESNVVRLSKENADNTLQLQNSSQKESSKILNIEGKKLDIEINNFIKTKSTSFLFGSPKASAKQVSMKIDDCFNDSDFDFLSQSVKKLNTGLRNSKITDKSLDANDILKIVETDNKRSLIHEQSDCEHVCSKQLKAFKPTIKEISNSQKENCSQFNVNDDNNNQKISDICKSFPNTENSVAFNSNLKIPRCSKIENKDNEISPSLIGKRPLNLFNLRQSTTHLYSKNCALNAETVDSSDDDTIILAPKRKGHKRLIDTDSEDENKINEDIILNSQIVEGTPGRGLSRKEQWKWNERRRKRRKRCLFIKDEAAHSGDDTDEETSVLNSMFVDSIVVSDDEEDDPSVNMQVKYLQSIRSPKRPYNGYKIPAPRLYMDLSKICSQPVVQESFTAYKEDSFVVSDEEEVCDGEVDDLDELDKAEAILKAKRKVRRLQTKLPWNRKRILNNIFEISDDDD